MKNWKKKCYLTDCNNRMKKFNNYWKINIVTTKIVKKIYFKERN